MFTLKLYCICFSDLVKEDRRMTKSMRELEREIQELKQISAENAAARGR